MNLARNSVVCFMLLVAFLVSATSAPAQTPDWKQLSAQARDLEHQGKYADALPLAIEALKAAEAELGPGDPWISVPASNLASVYDVLDRPAEAEPLYLRALQIHEKAFGAENPLVSMDAETLAVLYFRVNTPRPSLSSNVHCTSRKRRSPPRTPVLPPIFAISG